MKAESIQESNLGYEPYLSMVILRSNGMKSVLGLVLALLDHIFQFLVERGIPLSQELRILIKGITIVLFIVLMVFTDPKV
jgi:hypothetical protein